MGLLDDRLLAGSLAGLVLSVTLLVGVFGYVAVLAVAAVVPGGSGVDALLGVLFPAVLATAALVGTGLLSVVGLVVGVGRRLSVPKSERAAEAVGRVEAYSDRLASVGLSAHLAPPEPTVEERLAALKERYVEGELTEREFERRLREVVADDEERDPGALATDVPVETDPGGEYEHDPDRERERDPA
jgi:hypothetical protein